MCLECIHMAGRELWGIHTHTCWVRVWECTHNGRAKRVGSAHTRQSNSVGPTLHSLQQHCREYTRGTVSFHSAHTHSRRRVWGMHSWQGESGGNIHTQDRMNVGHVHTRQDENVGNAHVRTLHGLSVRNTHPQSRIESWEMHTCQGESVGKCTHAQMEMAGR